MPREYTDAEAAEALQRLDDVDSIASNAADHQSLIGQFLKSDEDLSKVLLSQNAELLALQELYMEEHCSQADNLAALYFAVNKCESDLESFEQQITTFQKSLTDTAEDIVKMQSQTVDLVRRVKNRKEVSKKIDQVYNALKECEEFCEQISTSTEVNDEFLNNIKKLESKIAFLANNPELQNSAVDQEIHPKLHAAAQKAGDKLHRYLIHKIRALSESSNTTLPQQNLEAIGQYAFSFLRRYNKRIAMDIERTYVRVMFEVYSKLFTETTQEYLTASESLNTVVEPILSIEAQRRIGFIPQRSVASSSSQARRDKSMSMSIKGFADRVVGKSTPMSSRNTPLREGTFVDIVQSLLTIDFQYGLVHITGTSAFELDDTNCWTWRLIKLLAQLVNAVRTESNFVSHFFFTHGSNLEEEEQLTREILGKSLVEAQQKLVSQLPFIVDRWSVFATLRAVDQMKGFLCQCDNPLPLLLLSSLFEEINAKLKKQLRTAMEDDLRMLAEAAQSLARAPMQPPAPPLSKPIAELLATDRNLVTAVAPHEMCRSFATMSSNYHLFNRLRLPMSRVEQSKMSVFDEVTATELRRELQTVVTMLSTVSTTLGSFATQKVFMIQNLVHILSVWSQMAVRFPQCGPPPQTQTQDGKAGGSAPPAPASAAPIFDVKEVTAQLTNEVAQFVVDDCRWHAAVSELFSYSQEAEAVLGSSFFSKDELTSGEIPKLTDALSPERTLQTMTHFNKGWRDEVRVIASSVKQCFSHGEDARENGEVAALVTREYFQSLLDANRRVIEVLNRLYPNDSKIQAKIVGNAALLHEVQQYLSDA